MGVAEERAVLRSCSSGLSTPSVTQGGTRVTEDPADYDKSGIPPADFSRALLPVAQPIADSPGLQWKIWLMNEADGEAGGIYLFEDEAAVNAFLGGPIVSAFKANPVVSDIRVKMFDVSEAHSLVTRGPVGRAVERAQQRRPRW